MAVKDGRDATQPYRVRVGGIWYWVDPTVPERDLEPGDTVVVYPAGRDAVLAVVQQDTVSASERLAFAALEGERFEVERGDVAALHLAAVDSAQ